MEDFYRTPILQVRDPRAISDRSDVEALKNFFDTSPPSDVETKRRHVSTSLSKSTDSRKQGKKRFFNLGKKRLSASDLEAEHYTYAGPKRSSLIPVGTTKRTVHGHTVIMIGSPAPPPAVVLSVQTPKLEITPPSPQIPLSPSSPNLQQVSVSFMDPVTPYMVPRSTNVSGTFPRGRNIGTPLPREGDNIPKSNFARPKLVTSFSENECMAARFHNPHDELPSKSSNNPSQTQTPASSESLFDFSFPSPVGRSSFHQTCGTTMRASVDGDVTPRQEALPLSALHFFGLQRKEVFEKRLEIVRITMDKAVQTTPVGRSSQSPGQKAANRRAIYENRSDMITSIPSTKATPDMALPPTPPTSSTSIPMLQNEDSGVILQSTVSSKKRGKKNKATAAPHSSPVPNPDFIHLEIMDLEEMDDKERAFRQLSEMYKHQKFLREAEETFHRQTIADLTAGMMAQKMENLKLVQLLQRRGVALPEIQSITNVSGDRPGLSRETSAETLSRDENPNLDPSRFVMLRKEEQFGQICDFTSSHSSTATPEQVISRHPEHSSDITAPLTLLRRAKSSTLGPPLTAPPSVPLPPVPSTRRTTQSMVVLNSTPQTSPIARSRSLTEGDISSIPYLDSFAIEQNMRRLERDYKRSLNGQDRGSTGSIGSRSSSEDILQFYEALGYEELSALPTASAVQFSLTVEDVDHGAFLDETTMDSIQAIGDSNSGPFTSPSLSSSVCTFHSVESSSDVEASTSSSSTSSSPDPNVEGTSVIGAFPLDRDESVDGTHSRHSIFTIVPSNDASAGPAYPRPANVDDSTWAALFMGLVRRPDGRAPSEGAMEHGESGSIRSIES